MYDTYEKIIKIMIKYKYISLTEFKKDNKIEYNYLVRHKLLVKFCHDMGWEQQKPNGYWTKERCMEEALKYKTKSEWRKKCSSSYNNAIKYHFINECIGHMIKPINPHGYWDKKRCIEEARKFKTRSEWIKKSHSSYSSAKRNGWFEECVVHMVELNKPNGYWAKERCMEVARKYKTKNEWRKNSRSSFSVAKRNGWFSECVANMVELNKPKGYWTKERCMEEALKYKTRTEWHKNHRKSYDAAHRKRWVDECATHMEKKR